MFCDPFDPVTDAVALLFRLGSRVKPLPCELERVADLSTTLTVALLPELTVIVPRLSVGELAVSWAEVPAAVVPKESVVAACEEALIDSITSAVTCPIAMVWAVHEFFPVQQNVRTRDKTMQAVVLMIYVLQVMDAIDK